MKRPVEVGEGDVEGETVQGDSSSTPFIYSADETLDIGVDDASAVSQEYTPQTSRFTGKVNWVELATDEAAEDADNYLDAEERFRVAMAIQ